MRSDTAAPLRLVLGGDVMLGRMVGKAILRRGPDYPLGALAGAMRKADLAIVNLECAITPSLRHWQGEPKAYYFGAPPEAALALAGAGVRLASLANNHILDYGEDGLRDTIAALDGQQIAHAGAGQDLAAAREPAVIECGGMRFGMAAFCDHQRDFAAGRGRPGIAWLGLDDKAGTLAALHQALATLLQRRVDWPILSLHWGPNMACRPDARMRRLAHAAVDMGWKIVFGHGAHVFQGIELRRGCPVLYAAGDLVDDYYVDPAFRNDHQLLFEMELGGGALRPVLQRILLHPLFIDRCRTQPADSRQAHWIARRMEDLCGELGTPLATGGTPFVVTPPLG